MDSKSMKNTQDDLFELKHPETLDDWLNTPLDESSAINRFKWKRPENTVDIGNGYYRYEEAAAILKKKHGFLAEKEIRDAVHNNTLGIYLLINPEQDVTSRKMQEIEHNDEYKSVSNINYEKRFFSAVENIYFERLMPKIACELLREGELVANVVIKKRVVNFHPTAIEKEHGISCHLAELIKVQHYLDQRPELKPRPNINMNEVYLIEQEIEACFDNADSLSEHLNNNVSYNAHQNNTPQEPARIKPRAHELHLLIERAYIGLQSELSRAPSNTEVWGVIDDIKYDKDEIIQEKTTSTVYYSTWKGAEKQMNRTTFNNLISKENKKRKKRPDST